MEMIVSVCKVFAQWWLSEKYFTLDAWRGFKSHTLEHQDHKGSDPQNIWSWWGFPNRDYLIPNSCHARFWVFSPAPVCSCVSACHPSHSHVRPQLWPPQEAGGAGGGHRGEGDQLPQLRWADVPWLRMISLESLSVIVRLLLSSQSFTELNITHFKNKTYKFYRPRCRTWTLSHHT